MGRRRRRGWNEAHISGEYLRAPTPDFARGAGLGYNLKSTRFSNKFSTRSYSSSTLEPSPVTGELLFRFWGAVLGEGISSRSIQISYTRRLCAAFVVNGGNYVPLHTVEFVRDTRFDARERTQLAVEAER